MTRRTLLLLSPPVLYAPTWWSSKVASKPHLFSLAGYVRDIADVRIVELDVNKGAAPVDVPGFLDGLDERIELDGVDLVGISCWTSLHYLGAVAVARKIRARQPTLPIVVGGHHPTAMPSDFVDAERLFDYVVRGDGENVLRGLVENARGQPAETEVIAAEPYRMSDPTRIDWATYPFHDPEQRVVWLGMSRGCPFKCTYCAEPQRGTDWNYYSVEDALAILEGLHKTHAPRVVCFSDPLFGARRQWTDELLDGILARGLGGMYWCETRADLMTPELLDKFRACGFKVDFGLDTGSETMAKLMVKSPSPAGYLRRARETIAHANAIDLFHDTYLLFNFPGETPETKRETMDFVESLAPAGGNVAGWVSSQSFFILPGTATFQRMDIYQKLYGTEIRHPGWWRETSDHNALATDVLPSDAYRGREHELREFQMWQTTINMDRMKRHSPHVSSFMRAFYGF